MDTFMREVHCGSCGSTTRHQLSILEKIIQLQAASVQGETYINYACPQCNMLTRSRVVRRAKAFREIDPTKFPDNLRIYAVSLQCAKKGCKSRVELLAPVMREITEGELLLHVQMNWCNRSALCAENHPPSYPLQIRDWVMLTGTEK